MPDPSGNRRKYYRGNDSTSSAQTAWNVLMSDPIKYRDQKRYELRNMYGNELERIKSGTSVAKTSVPAYLGDIVREANEYANDFIRNSYYYNPQTGEEGIITPKGFYRRNEDGSYRVGSLPQGMSRDEFMDRAYNAMRSLQEYQARIMAGNEVAQQHRWKLDTSKIDPFIDAVGIIYNQYGDMKTQGLSDEIVPSRSFQENYNNYMNRNYNNPTISY